MRFVILLCLLGLGGCAYTFSTSLPGHVKTVQIPVLDNQTLEISLTEELTSAVTDEFIRRNQLEVIQGSADAVLEGQIVGYEDRVFGFDSQQKADEYIVVVTVDMALRDRVRNKDLWREEGVRGVASYFPGTSQTGTPSTVEAARTQAMRQIVDFAITRTFEGW